PLTISAPERTVTFTAQEGGGVPITVMEEERRQAAAAVQSGSAEYAPIISLTELLTIIWIIGALIFLLFHLVSYWSFRRRIKPYLKKEEIDFSLRVYRCERIESPMMTGFFRPVILLPEADYTHDELEMILTHEYIHYRRGDLWYKLLLVFSNALHWFNPIVYLMTRRANRDIEYSCDEAVTKNRDIEFRKRYSMTILKTMSRKNEPLLSTSFSQSGKSAKKRLTNVLNTRAKRAGAAVIIMAAAGIIAAGAFVALRSEPASKPADEKTFAERLYETKHPYVGDMSANGETVRVLGMAEELGNFTNELHTSAEPYGWTLHFGTEFAEKGENLNNEKMENYAVLLMSLTDNLSYVEWDYPIYNGTTVSRALSARSAVPDVNIKEMGESPEKIETLLGIIEYDKSFENSVYVALSSADVEDFKKNALVIGNDGAENLGKLNEFLNKVALEQAAALDIVQYTHEGDPILMRLCTDGNSFWGGEYDGHDQYRGDKDYYNFGAYPYLKISRIGDSVEFYLVKDENLTIDEINDYLLSSRLIENPPEFRILFYLEEGESYEEAIY
ncbi:MAG: M56 family metallopeptidase, partial [Clostridia bacterium]